MTFADYQRIDAVNWSTLKELRRSPLHYSYRVLTPLEDSARFAMGRAVHCALLQPERLAEDFPVFDGAARRGAAWDQFRDAQAPTATVLRRDEYERCLGVRNAVKADPVAGPLFEAGAPEQTVQWTDEVTGVACKARLDWVSAAGALVDLKTAGTVEPRQFSAHAARLGYHCQLAFYRRGLMATGRAPASTKLVAVEAEPPHDVVVFGLSEDVLYAGDEEVSELLAQLADCRGRGAWPGTARGHEQPLALPGWVFLGTPVVPALPFEEV